MDTSFDAGHGQAVGSRIRMNGKMMGIELSLEEVVTERVPPRHKAWETVGNPRLLVIGGYRLGFGVVSANDTLDLRVLIDYDLPRSPASRWCSGRCTQSGGLDGWSTARVIILRSSRGIVDPGQNPGRQRYGLCTQSIGGYCEESIMMSGFSVTGA